MNKLIRSLIEKSGLFPLEEKWLISPTLRIGNQWVEQVARNSKGIVNLRPRTLCGMALEIAGPEMARNGIELASTLKTEILIAKLWGKIHSANSIDAGYLTRINPDLSLAQALFRTIQSVRTAEVELADIQNSPLESNIKRDELSKFFDLYVNELKRQKLIDYPGATQLAIKLMEKRGLKKDVLVFLPETEDFALDSLERHFIRKLPDKQVVRLEHDQHSTPLSSDSENLTDTQRLRWILKPAEAPQKQQDGSVEFFRAAGTVNEIREIFRRCAKNRIPFDDVEILYPNSSIYVPLLHEVAGALFPEHSPQANKNIVTFEEGLPVLFTKPGQALRAWVQWQEEDFPQSLLERMIQDGLLKRENRQEISHSELADTLRGLPIFHGKDNYISRIENQLRTEKHRLQESETDEDGETVIRDKNLIERKIKCLKVLKHLVNNVLDHTPNHTGNGILFLESAKIFLKNSVNISGILDSYSLNKLIDDFNLVIETTEEESNSAGIDLKNWAKELPAELNIGGTGPRPGAIHAANMLSGGNTGRRHTFIIGLDDSNFPQPLLQDPLLLDSERARLTKELPTSQLRAQRDLQDFAAMLAGLRGNVTLSYTSRDIKEDSELSPCPYLIAAYRITSGNREADLEVFLNSGALGTEVSFSPASEEECLNLSDTLMEHFCSGSATDDRRQTAAAFFPLSQSALEAENARNSNKFTSFDGYVPSAGADLNPFNNPKRALSPSRLETLGDCPLKYFFADVLKVRLPNEFKYDPDQWLDPLEKGSILHDVFHDFMLKRLDRGDIPDIENTADLQHIFDILDSKLKTVKEKIPPPRQDLEESTSNIMRETCRTFITAQKQFFHDGRPIFLESAIGFKNKERLSPLDSKDPVGMALNNQKSIYLHGRIDRIDELRGTTGKIFSVWDYKTGGKSKYLSNNKKKLFDQGRIVQHAVYHHIAQNRLSNYLNSPVKVEFFGYFFPSPKADGEVIKYSPNDLADGKEVVRLLCETLANGAFIAASNSNKCHYCDYKAICGDTSSTTTRAEQKLNNVDNHMLQPRSEVQEYKA